MANGVAVMNTKGYGVIFRATVYNDANGGEILYTSPWDTEIIRDDKLALVWEREPDEYFYRPKLNGKIKFVGELARQIVEVMSNEGYVELLLRERLISQKYSAYEFSNDLKFRVRKSDCKVSAIRKIYPGTDGQGTAYYYTLDVESTPIDWYEKIIDNWDKEYDLIKLKVPRTDIEYVRRPCLQIYAHDSVYLGNFLGGNYWETEISNTDNMLAENKRFSEVFKLRYIKVESTIPSATGVKPDGIYAIDLTDAETQYPDSLSSTPNRFDYYMYKDGDSSASEALHVYLWGAQANQTLEISFSRKTGDVWSDRLTIVQGKQAPEGYDFFYFGDPHRVYPGRIVSFTPASENITKVEMRENTYYARWYLPRDEFSDREVYAKPTDDPTVAGDIIGYKYISPALKTDLEIKFGISDDTPDIYGQNDDGQYFHAPDQKYCPMLISSWDYLGIWLNRESFNTGVESEGREFITISDGYDLSTVLKYLFLATKYDGDITGHESEITIVQPDIQDNPTSNRPKQLSCLKITPKSNIVRGLYTMAAQKAPITLRSVLDMLKTTRKLYWYKANGSTDINFVHEEYFLETLPSQQIDYEIGDFLDCGLWNPRNRRPINWSNEAIEYNKDDIHEREKFGWMDSSTEPFNGHTIINVGNLVKPDDEKENKVQDFTSDMDFMIISPNECSLDGFALIYNGDRPPHGQTSYVIFPVTYLGVQYTVGNAMLSFIRLFEEFLSTRRPTSQYKYLYGSDIYTAQELDRVVNQTVKMPIPLIDDRPTTYVVWPITDNSERLYGRIITAFGEGTIKKISINILSRNADITLEQEPNFLLQ